jgi:TPR repeat protein
MYETGKGVDRDYNEASRWYHLAAEQKNPLAQLHLGEMYELGQGVPQNYIKATEWYTRSADQGQAEAQFKLGNLYAFLEDPVNAHMWFNLCGASGHEKAQKRLAEIASVMTHDQIEKAQELANKWSVGHNP